MPEHGNSVHRRQRHGGGGEVDCGASRDVTDSRAPEAVAARAQFDGLLKDLPAPRLDHDGAPNEKNDPDSRRGARQAKKAAKKAKTP